MGCAASLAGCLFVCAGLQSDGKTPLHGASEGGHVECVRLLLDRGVGVDVVGVSTSCFARIVWRGLCAVCGERLWMFVSELGCVKASGCVFEDVAIAGMVVCRNVVMHT